MTNLENVKVYGEEEQDDAEVEENGYSKNRDQERQSVRQL